MSNSIDLSGILGKKFTLTGIPSPAHPDGGSYEIPSLSAQDGALLQIIAAGSDGEGSITGADAGEAMVEFCRDADGNEVDLNRKLLGDALDEMVGDGISNDDLQDIVAVVMAKATFGTEAARLYVARASGEAPARANRATRRAAAKKTSSPRKAGSKSPQASGAKNTPAARASTRGPAASAKPQKKAV